VRGKESVFEGSLNADSRRSGAGRAMYSAVPTAAVATVVVRIGRRANMAAIANDCRCCENRYELLTALGTKIQGRTRA